MSPRSRLGTTCAWACAVLAVLLVLAAPASRASAGQGMGHEHQAQVQEATAATGGLLADAGKVRALLSQRMRGTSGTTKCTKNMDSLHLCKKTNHSPTASPTMG